MGSNLRRLPTSSKVSQLLFGRGQKENRRESKKTATTALTTATTTGTTMALEAGLIWSVGAFFGVQTMILCTDWDDSIPGAWEDLLLPSAPWPTQALSPQDVSAALGATLESGGRSGGTRPVLVACEAIAAAAAADLREEDLAANVVWLVPKEPLSASLLQLPLRLDSFLLGYSEGGGGGGGGRNYTLSEFYAVKKAKYLENHFGTWTPGIELRTYYLHSACNVYIRTYLYMLNKKNTLRIPI